MLLLLLFLIILIIMIHANLDYMLKCLPWNPLKMSHN